MSRAGLWDRFDVEFEEDWNTDWPESEKLEEALEYVYDSGGKRLRPLMVMSCCSALDGDMEEARVFAGSVETLHNFSLVHDDIIDGDEKRRNQQTVWKRYGREEAVEVGDALQAMSYGHLARKSELFQDGHLDDLLQLLVRADRRIAEGQLKELELRDMESPGTDDYLEMVERKTGALFEACLEGAAVTASRQDVRAELSEAARELSIGFQVKDDVIDLRGGKGRSEAMDIAEGKRSYIVVQALDSLEPGRADALLGILDTPRWQTGDSQIGRAVDMMEETGAIDSAEEEAVERVEEAISILEGIEMEDGEDLLELVRFLAERKF